MVTRIPAETFHPGEFIAEELEARGLTQSDLHRATGLPRGAVSLIISGKRDITARTSLLLAKAFTVSEELFLNLQRSHDLATARKSCARELRKVTPLWRKRK